MPFTKQISDLDTDARPARLSGRQGLFCSRVAGGASGAEPAGRRRQGRQAIMPPRPLSKHGG